MNKLSLGALAAGLCATGMMILNSTGAFAQAAGASDAALMATLMSEGQDLYEHNCSGCHGHDGEGNVGPQLAGNDFVSRNGAIITQILEGNEDHGMPPFDGRLTAEQIAAIATYVRNSWGNAYGITTEANVNVYLSGG